MPLFSVQGGRARHARPWQHRVGFALGVAALQLLFAIGLIRGGYSPVAKAPDHMTVIDIKLEKLAVKAPPPTMPEIRMPNVPASTITFDVQPETAITLPPPRPEAAKPATATGGVSPILGYQKAVLRRIEAAKHYPLLARKQQRQGVALVEFAMDRAGRVLSASLVKSSGASLLDREAVEAVRRAAPFPAPPAELDGDPMKLMVAVEFALH